MTRPSIISDGPVLEYKHRPIGKNGLVAKPSEEWYTNRANYRVALNYIPFSYIASYLSFTQHP